MLALHPWHDDCSIFYEDITGDLVRWKEMIEWVGLDREEDGKHFMENREEGWLIEGVKYAEREDGCLLMLAANGERQQDSNGKTQSWWFVLNASTEVLLCICLAVILKGDILARQKD